MTPLHIYSGLLSSLNKTDKRMYSIRTRIWQGAAATSLADEAPQPPRPHPRPVTALLISSTFRIHTPARSILAGIEKEKAQKTKTAASKRRRVLAGVFAAGLDDLEEIEFGILAWA